MLSDNPKGLITNFWQLKLGIIVGMGLLFICCLSIFTWYPFALFSNLGAAFVAIAAITIFTILWKFNISVRTYDLVFYFFRGILVCIAGLAILVAVIGPIFIQPRQIAVASLNNHQYQLLYTRSCFDFCTGNLALYRCDFIIICPKVEEKSTFAGWVGPYFSTESTHWAFSNEVKVVSLSIDPASGGINVSYDGKVVYTFKSP